MVIPHLISTSAHMNIQNRVDEYVTSYNIIFNLRHLFKSITIIETVSQESLEYLENTGLDVIYSNLGNTSPNKGVNWLNHVKHFLDLSKIDDNDIIIFITGRYKIVNTNILSLIETHMIIEKNEFIAKNDNDLYSGEKGVHTFYMAFTKSKFLDFWDWYQKNSNFTDCIEWDVKKYLETHDKCIILSENIIMGVETRVFQLNNNKIC